LAAGDGGGLGVQASLRSRKNLDDKDKEIGAK
jgi:hypothetical protein